MINDEEGPKCPHCSHINIDNTQLPKGWSNIKCTKCQAWFQAKPITIFTTVPL